MIKRLFGIFIPLCIFSFIAFGISAAILGTGYGSYNYAEVEEDYVGSATMVGTASSDSWELNESYSNIRLDVGAYNVSLYPGDDDSATYFVTNRVNGDNTEIYTEIVGDTLEVSISDTFSFINFGFDYLERLIEAIRTGEGFEDIFKGSRLDIVVPARIYDTLEINMGAGSVEICDINADCNILNIGSGRMDYTSYADHISDSMSIELGSGYISTNGLRTREYNININSGRYELNGISGSGTIDINSGSGWLDFSEIDGDNYVYMNSGTMGIGLPADASLKLNAEINSGSIRVDTVDHNSRLHEGDILTIGGGEYNMSFDLNSGTIRIFDSTTQNEQNEASVSEIPPVDIAVVEGSDVERSVTIADVVPSTGLTEIEFIEAPSAPSAPTPPSAPSYSSFMAGYTRV